MVTVMIYLGAVFGGGTLLSLYYIIFWDPNIKVPKPATSSSRWRRELTEHLVESHHLPDVAHLGVPPSMTQDAAVIRKYTEKYNSVKNRVEGKLKKIKQDQEHPNTS